MELPEGCNVFISWSKPRAGALAQALYEWLPQINHKIKPWVSSRNISVGDRWNDEVWLALRAARHGIICVTPENQREPWLLFESGAMANNREVPISVYRFGISETDIEAPLGQFQSAAADKDGTFKLLSSVNASLPLEDRQPDANLQKQFGKWWSELAAKIEKYEAIPPEPQERSVPDMVREILATVRSLGSEPMDANAMENAYRIFRRYWRPQTNSELRDLESDVFWIGQANYCSSTFMQFIGDGLLSQHDANRRFVLSRFGSETPRTVCVQTCHQMPGFFVADLVPPPGAIAFEDITILSSDEGYPNAPASGA